jgi:phosphopentomutase
MMVLDSVGIGEAPDADDFDDIGCDTLGHIADTVDDFSIPNLRSMGLGNIDGFDEMTAVDSPSASWGRMRERSPGKDSTTGHWELAGLILDKPFRTFPDGFGDNIIDPFVEQTGCGGVLGNKPESGTVIIKELGQEHEQTGQPIVYTSADPVFQIAAHVDAVDIDTLYEWCEIAYDIVVPRGIGRVIARPFEGEWPNYNRISAKRKDFSCPPPEPTLLNHLQTAGIRTTGVGKIGNLFNSRGLDAEFKTEDNQHGVDETLDQLAAHRDTPHFVFTNLVDFDSEFGHRRDPEGYAGCLEEFDDRLPELLDALEPGDLFILTADHGNDPTFRGTDHTREYVPLLTLEVTDSGDGLRPATDLGTRDSFCDAAATVADYFDIDSVAGDSFLADTAHRPIDALAD